MSIRQKHDEQLDVLILELLKKSFKTTKAELTQAAIEQLAKKDISDILNIVRK